MKSAGTITLSNECDIEYELISKGSPERGPSYGCAGEPAEPPEFQITIKLGNTDITKLLTEEQMDEVYDHVRDNYESSEDYDCGPEPCDEV